MFSNGILLGEDVPSEVDHRRSTNKPPFLFFSFHWAYCPRILRCSSISRCHPRVPALVNEGIASVLDAEAACSFWMTWPVGWARSRAVWTDHSPGSTRSVPPFKWNVEPRRWVRLKPYRVRISSGDTRVENPLRHTLCIGARSEHVSRPSGLDPPIAEGHGAGPPSPRTGSFPLLVPRGGSHPRGLPRPLVSSPLPPSSSAGHGGLLLGACGPQGRTSIDRTNSSHRSDVHIVRLPLRHPTSKRELPIDHGRPCRRHLHLHACLHAHDAMPRNQVRIRRSPAARAGGQACGACGGRTNERSQRDGRMRADSDRCEARRSEEAPTSSSVPRRTSWNRKKSSRRCPRR